MFGWDWGPQLVDTGIFRKIGLKCWSGPQLREVYLRQHHDGGRVTLSVYSDLTEFPGEDKDHYAFAMPPSGLDYETAESPADPV